MGQGTFDTNFAPRNNMTYNKRMKIEKNAKGMALAFRRMGISEGLIKKMCQDIRKGVVNQNRITLFLKEMSRIRGEDLLRITEVAEILKVSKKTAYRLLQKRRGKARLRSYKFGDSLRVKQKDLEEFVSKAKVK